MECLKGLLRKDMEILQKYVKIVWLLSTVHYMLILYLKWTSIVKNNTVLNNISFSRTAPFCYFSGQNFMFELLHPFARSHGLVSLEPWSFHRRWCYSWLRLRDIWIVGEILDFIFTAPLGDLSLAYSFFQVALIPDKNYNSFVCFCSA